MAKLGKWVTVAGGGLIVLFALIGMIAFVSSGETIGGRRYGPSGWAIFSAIVQFLILGAVGGAVAIGAALKYDKLAVGLCWLAAASAVLALAYQPGLRFYIVLGSLAAIIGANWDKCGGQALAEALAGEEHDEEEKVVYAAPPPSAPPGEGESPGEPPESKL